MVNANNVVATHAKPCASCDNLVPAGVICCSPCWKYNLQRWLEQHPTTKVAR
jgi:hypothetical protein